MSSSGAKVFRTGDRVARYDPWIVDGELIGPSYWWGTIIEPCKKRGSYWICWDHDIRPQGMPGKGLLCTDEVPVSDPGLRGFFREQVAELCRRVTDARDNVVRPLAKVFIMRKANERCN